MTSVYDEIDLKAKPGAFSTFDMEFMEPFVEKLTPGQTYIEVGVDKGKSLSVARMVSVEGVNIIGVDVRENPNVPGTEFFRRNSHAPGTPAATGHHPDILFIDGDHSYEGCKADITMWSPYMQPGSIIFFHDCDITSPGVVQAATEFALSINRELIVSPEQRCSMARIEL